VLSKHTFTEYSRLELEKLLKDYVVEETVLLQTDNVLSTKVKAALPPGA
jgi:hypothetical protein